MFGKLALRDLVSSAVVVLAWVYLSHLSAGKGTVSDLMGVVLGFAAGGVAYAAHEWGHLLGALACGSTVRAPSSWRSVSLFSFDSRANGRRQFLIMSFAGFAMTGLALVVVYNALPEGLLATRVARGAVLFLTALTVVLEFPLVVWSLLRSDLPPVETFDRGAPRPPAEAAELPRSG